MLGTVVTGGYSGVGLGCAEALREAGHTVVIAARDVGKAQAIAERMGPRAAALELDLSRLASVRAAAERLAARDLPPLAGLVLNAGIMALSEVRTTADGFELNFGTNHLGHFHFANLLLPRVREGGRVVVVSSSGHDPTTMAGRSGPPQWIGAEALARPTADAAGGLPPMSRYTTSKLCNVLHAYELDRRLKAAGRDVAVHAFDPGVVVGTALGRDLGAFNRFLVSQSWLLRWMGARVVSAEDAGRHLAQLAVHPRFAGSGGRYFEGTTETRSSDASYDAALQRELWEVSERLVAEAEAGGVRGATGPLRHPHAGL